MANVRPKPNEMFTEKKSFLPLNKNCATEAKEKDKNKNVPNNSAKNSFVNLF